MFSFTSFSQTVTLKGPSSGKVEVGIPANFTATVTLDGQTVTKYEWKADYLGNSGTINGITNPVSVEIQSTSATSTVPIMWDGTYDPGYVRVYITVYLSDNSELTTSLRVYKNGINSFLWISGDNTIQKCCSNNTEYEVVNYAEGNIFTWTYPSGWTLISGAGTDKITLKPNTSGGGEVKCVVGRKEAISTYTKSTTLNISRYNPSLGHYLYIPSKICPGDNFSLQVSEKCGASYYNWSLPTGWTIASGQGTHIINVHITNSPQNGTVSCSVSFNGGCSTSISRYASVLTTPPPTPVFNLHNEPGEYDLGYHCDKFNVKPQNGGTRIEVNHIAGADTYHWTVSAPWSVNPVYSTYPWTTITGPSNAPFTGTVTVSAINCIGEGNASSQLFYREKSYWCTHAYPCYCECCQPPGDDGHPYELGIGGNNENTGGSVVREHSQIEKRDRQTSLNNLTTIKETGIYPNPGNNRFVIFIADILPETHIKITDIKGRLIKTVNNVNQLTQIDMQQEPSGIYFVTIYNAEKIKTLKLVKQ